MWGRKYLRHVQQCASDDSHTHTHTHIYIYNYISIWCTLAIYIIIYIVLLFPRFRVPTSGSILILKNTLLSTATIVYTIYIYIYMEDIGVKSLLPDQPFFWTAVLRVKQFLIFSGTDFFISGLPYTRERLVFMSFISSSALSRAHIIRVFRERRFYFLPHLSLKPLKYDTVSCTKYILYYIIYTVVYARNIHHHFFFSA